MAELPRDFRRITVNVAPGPDVECRGGCGRLIVDRPGIRFCSECAAREERAEMLRHDAGMVGAALESIPNGFRWATVETADGVALLASRCRTYRRLEEILRDVTSRTGTIADGLTLIGAAGLGKTSVAVACFRAWVLRAPLPAERRATARFVSARMAPRLSPAEFEAATRASLVLLDDLGAEGDMPSSRAPVADLLAERHAWDRPTIVTTFHSGQSVAARYGDGIARREREPAEPPAIDGKPPPHDLDAEAATIAAVLLNEAVYLEIADIIRAEHFYSEAHRQIWKAIATLAGSGKPIDVVTVASQLKDEQRIAQVGGTGYISQLLDTAPHVDAVHVRAYAGTVLNHWRSRQAILVCQRYAGRGYVERSEPGALLRELEADVMKLSAETTRDRLTEMRPLLRRVFDRISKTYSDKRPPGIPTGFQGYDDLVVGLHRQEVTLIAARPGMGKTALMLSMALNIAGAQPLLLSDDGSPWVPFGVGFFSLEMPEEQLGQRLIAIESRVNSHRMRTGRLHDDDWSPMTLACHHIAEMPILIDDTSSLTPSKLRSGIRRMKQRFANREKPARLAVVFVDYLQLMKADGRHSNRETEIGEISRAMKEIAKDEDVAILPGCQLNRALETRTGAEKRPRISDLRESGNLEQDADNILFLYRGEVYGDTPPEGEEGKTELILGKQRNGPVGTAYARYTPGCTRFDNLFTY